MSIGLEIMCLHHHQHSIFCIVPQYVLRSISQKGTSTQRVAANKTLAVDQTFRAMRASLATQVPAAQRRRRMPGPEPVKQREIYTANNEETLPGTLVRTEGADPTGDAAVDEAYDGLGHTFDFFWDIFTRHSIDDEGALLSATVHYGLDYNNAFWNGQRMVFGDGDKELFNRFTIALDIIGHELGHGITEDEAGLVYMFEPGALNEHLSDVWGSLIKQWVLKQPADQADWLIGAGLLGPNVAGKALRSMKEPGTAFDDPILGKDRQPAHMKDFERTWDDNGGVHINSGIPNRAFYLAASAMGGYAWEKAGRIWYNALLDNRLRPETKFRRFARLTVDVAGQLYGIGSDEQRAVGDAWAQVGVIEVKVS